MMSMDRADKVSPDFIGYAAASGQRTAHSGLPISLPRQYK